MTVKRKRKKKMFSGFRVPLPRQTGGAHKPAKGGRHDRRRAKSVAKDIVKESLSNERS
jgi:hypothetical protein